MKILMTGSHGFVGTNLIEALESTCNIIRWNAREDKPLPECDTVIHLAAQAGVRYSIDHPDVYIESNLIGFFNVLEACRNNPVEHLVYASSSSAMYDSWSPE